MPLRGALLALLLVLAAAPAWAVRDWYDFYQDGKQQADRGRCKEALANLAQARRLKPSSELEVRLYGLVFIDYVPYYYEGVCHVKAGDFKAALAAFDAEEKQGAIQKNRPLYASLGRLRGEAKKALDDAAAAERAAEAEKKARALLEELHRLRLEGDELYRQGKLEEALAPLGAAQKVAEGLGDSATQRDIMESIKKIRTEANDRQEAEARAARIQRDLAEGQQLLQAGKGTEAKLKFADVLSVDPRNARAAEGQTKAEEQILATTTRQVREAAFARGKSLFEAGRFDEARGPLSEAGADTDNAEAHRLLGEATRILEGLRKAKETHTRTDALLGQAKALLAARRFSEAWAKLGSVLALDPGNEQAKERSAYAERMTAETAFENIFPNERPILTFWEAPGSVVERPTLALHGVATDDRGLVRMEYRVDGQLVRRQELAAIPRNQRFDEEFPLQAGQHQISVTAVDTSDASAVTSFDVTRQLRFYESKAFLPSAGATALGLLGAGLVVQHARRRRALHRRFNPYIAGAPIMADNMFFGRRKLLNRIMNVLHHNSLMITGERRIGKTTFLYHLKKALETDEGTEYKFFPVFTDLQGVPEQGFFHAVMSDVVDSLGLSTATMATLRFRIDDENYDGRDFSHDLQRVIEDLKTRTPRRVKLALLIDEVDVLNDYSERINQRLRSIFMKTFSEHLVAIMSGVGIKRVWTSEGSPWYNFFDEIELTAFVREEAEALIREPVEGVFRFEPEAVEAILTGSQLKPYVIQKFCIHAVSRMLEQGRTTVTAADVDAVRDAVQFEGRPHEDSALAARASA
jgi:tetratricopeptide (TPR) repeat protein